jgi:hypothetical protein
MRRREFITVLGGTAATFRLHIGDLLDQPARATERRELTLCLVRAIFRVAIPFVTRPSFAGYSTFTWRAINYSSIRAAHLSAGATN